MIRVAKRQARPWLGFMVVLGPAGWRHHSEASDGGLLAEVFPAVEEARQLARGRRLAESREIEVAMAAGEIAGRAVQLALPGEGLSGEEEDPSESDDEPVWEGRDELDRQVRKTPSWPRSSMGQLQPLTAVFSPECRGQLASSGPT